MLATHNSLTYHKPQWYYRIINFTNVTDDKYYMFDYINI